MKLFEPTTFTWDQLGELKWASLLIGIAVGATWPDIFAPYAWPLFIIGIILAIPPTIVWFREH